MMNWARGSPLTRAQGPGLGQGDVGGVDAGRGRAVDDVRFGERGAEHRRCVGRGVQHRVVPAEEGAVGGEDGVALDEVGALKIKGVVENEGRGGGRKRGKKRVQAPSRAVKAPPAAPFSCPKCVGRRARPLSGPTTHRIYGQVVRAERVFGQHARRASVGNGPRGRRERARGRPRAGRCGAQGKGHDEEDGGVGAHGGGGMGRARGEYQKMSWTRRFGAERRRMRLTP